MSEKATLVGLSMDDPSASVRDPAFQTLIRDGWKIAAHLPAERGGRQEWVFLMVPPTHSQEAKTPWWKSPLLPLWVLVGFNSILVIVLGVAT